ncbi:hypothetical protein GCM10027414_04920 [Humibacter ginsengiterrae]
MLTVIAFVAGVIAVLALCVLLWLGIEDLMDWLQQWRDARAARIEAELDRTQEQLRATMLQLAEALAQDAHQARRALIRESFLASGQMPPRD